MRPFFLENANYFSTPLNLVNTRNIAHPEFGGRVTGKLGKTNLGFFTIDDRAPGEAVGPGELGYKKRALYAVGRISEDVGKNSSVGVIYTDEEFAGSWSRVGGVDFNARLSDKWTLTGQAVESSTRAEDGSYAAGPASTLEINRSGDRFNLDDTYTDFSTGFQTQTGFIRTNNSRQNSNYVNYLLHKKNSLLQRYGLEGNSQIAFDHQGNRLYRYVNLDLPFFFARNTVFAPLFGENSDTLGPASYSTLPGFRNFSENFAGGIFRSAPLPQVHFDMTALYSGNVNYNPAAGASPSLMHQNYLQALVTLQPIASLTMDETYLLDRNHSARNGAAVFENQTLRTKINYQFTRAFSARVIVEYDSLLVNKQETSLVRTKQVSTQALLTWLPHPGTAIYVGYNNDLQNLNHTICGQLVGGRCDPSQPILPRAAGYLNDGRQFFVKASYLLRF